jgi:flagellar biosynthesis/type III secretory pathway protein FliH
MILRGAFLSDEPRTLEVAREPVGRTAAPAASPVPVPLSVELMVDWLEHCDGLARANIARHLATDIETLRLEAQADGFEAGRAQGLKDARLRMEASAAMLETAARAAQEALDAEAIQLTDLCADIIVEALTKIAGPILTSREAAVGAVVKILERVKDECELLIKVNRADLPVLQELEGTLRRALAGRQFSITADDSVGLGGCIVGSQLGTFDGRVEVQLAGLLESIRGARELREVAA